MIYLSDGELVDTYGGDYTYRDVWAEYKDGEWSFFDSYYGAKPRSIEQIIDSEELERFTEQLKQHPDYHE